MRPGERPSIVVTRLFAAALIVVRQERIGSPSMWTAQAAHWPIPQPYLVPVSPSVSRNTQSRGVSGLTSTVSRLPLTVSVKDVIAFLVEPRLFEITAWPSGRQR